MLKVGSPLLLIIPIPLLHPVLSSVTLSCSPMQLQPDIHIMQENAKTVDDLVRTRSSTNPDHPTVVFGHETAYTYTHTYTTTDINTYTTQAAHLYTKRYKLAPRSAAHKQKQKQKQEQVVVGVLAPTTPEYLITILGVARRGHAALLLSPRLAPDVVLYLLRQAGATLFLCAGEHEHEYQHQLQGDPSLVVGRVLRHDEYACRLEPEPERGREIEVKRECEENDIVWILHSSGSTGLPKLVPVTNRSALARYADAADILGKHKTTLSTLPMFHAFGMTAVFRMLWCGGTVQMWDPGVPVTTAALGRVVRQGRGKWTFGLFATVPAVLKMLAEDDEGVRFLRGFEVVTSGGSSLADALGDYLTGEGVRVVSIYGMYVYLPNSSILLFCPRHCPVPVTV